MPARGRSRSASFGDHVPSGSAAQAIPAVASVERAVTRVARHPVVAAVAEHGVVPSPGLDAVVALAGADHVIAAGSAQAVRSRRPGDRAAETFGARLGLPVYVDNDANLGALAERRWGAAAGRRNAAYLKVSTGIGAGLIVNGRLFHGAGGMAGEIGHTIIQEQGPVCRCGKRGCLETLAGAAALVELLRGTHGPDLTTQGLLAAAASGDSGARRVLADAGRHIGTAVATLCDLLNPELIVVGGELSAVGEVLLDPLREQVHRHAIPATARGLEIVPGVLGPRAELLGTLALVLASDSRAVTPPVA